MTESPTLANLNEECLKFVSHCVSNHIKLTKNTIELYLSHYILKSFFNLDWLKKLIYNDFDFKNSTNLFNLTIDITRNYKLSPINELKHFQRIVILAESLFCFQPIPNFRHFLSGIKKLENRHEDHLYIDFQSKLAEVQAARFLYLCDAEFEFVIEKSQKGTDYDFLVTLGSGRKLGCEVKCKTEEKEFNLKSYLRSLNKADSQIKDQDNKIIIIKIPTEWSKHPDFHQIFNHVDLRFHSGMLIWEHIFQHPHGLRIILLNRYHLKIEDFNPPEIEMKNNQLTKLIYKKIEEIESNPRYTHLNQVIENNFPNVFKYGFKY